MTAILGIDPSTVATGWALLYDGESVIASGLYVPAGEGDARLLHAYRWLRGMVDAHEPDIVAVETPFFKLNARTLITLASLGAAFRLAAAIEGVPLVGITPAQRGPALGLAGNAGKTQILYTVNAVYGLDLADHNVADAVAIAAAAAQVRTAQAWEAYA